MSSEEDRYYCEFIADDENCDELSKKDKIYYKKVAEKFEIVKNWLTDIGMKNYIHIFKDKEILDLKSLEYVKGEHLEDEITNDEDLKKILSNIEKIKDYNNRIEKVKKWLGEGKRRKKSKKRRNKSKKRRKKSKKRRKKSKKRIKKSKKRRKSKKKK